MRNTVSDVKKEYNGQQDVEDAKRHKKSLGALERSTCESKYKMKNWIAYQQHLDSAQVLRTCNH